MSTAIDITIEQLQDIARRLGLDKLCVAPAAPFEETERVYLDRLQRGFLGEMRWITPERIRSGCHPEELLPGAKSIIIAASSYLTANEGQGVTRTGKETRPYESLAPLPSPLLRGRVARYALNDDYHDTIKEKLQQLHAELETLHSAPVRSRLSVDSGPVVDRAVAARAGLGWYGKNTNILTPELGSWVLLGAMIVDVELPYTQPLRKSCGACTRCIVACPTGALVAPGILDSRRCISYLTIELKGPIPRDLRPLIGNWIFGCDICQEVCPVNRRAPVIGRAEYVPRAGWGPEPDLIELMSISDEEFRARFKGSPVKRTKRRGLLRNVAVALGNSGDPRAIPVLIHALSDHESLVRGHAAWALGRLGTEAELAALQQARDTESDDWVREELELAMAEIAA